MNTANDASDNTPDVDSESDIDNTDTDTDTDTDVEMQAAELEQLKAKADQLGVGYHPSIKAAKLRNKIREHQDALEAKELAEANEVGMDDGSSAASVPKKNRTPAEARAAAMSLVRCQVTCMDPSKKAYNGELITAGNSAIGTVRKFVPFGRDFHIPRIMFNVLRDKQYVQHIVVELPNGMERKEKQLVRAYNVAELPPLTKAEISEIAERQSNRAPND